MSSSAAVIRLANDVSRQFAALPEDVASRRVAEHIHAFWEPRMIAQLHLIAADPTQEAINPVALLAAQHLEHL